MSSETEKGPGVGAPEPRCIAQQASANPEYPQTGQDGNPTGPGRKVTCATPAAGRGRSGLEGHSGAIGGARPLDAARAAYIDSEGRIWAYRGKRARVLDLLASSPGGVTPWDCLPWHTRLGASIHAMREDGLTISTELEGPYRHARYRLATRLAPLKNYQRISNGGGNVG